MQEKLDQLRAEALDAVKAAGSKEALEELRVGYLGRKGEITALSKQIKNVPPENRREFGQAVNELKNNVAKAIENRLGDLKKGRFDAIEEIERIDVTLPGLNPPRGHLHPLTQIQSELEDIFSSMGFSILDGPELETDENNFEKTKYSGRPSRPRHAGTPSGPKTETCFEPTPLRFRFVVWPK